MDKLRKLLERIFGYRIIRKDHFPAGNDLYLDLRYRFHVEIKTVFDIGANTGQMIPSWKEAFPEVHIHAFEPVSNTFQKLQQTIQPYKDVFAEPIGFGNEAGSFPIYLEENSQWNSLRAMGKHQEKMTETIEVHRLDDYLAERKIDHIDVLKIDTEGFDLEVLKGGEQSLKNQRVSFIYAETALHREDQRHTPLGDLVEYLQPLGYYFYHLYNSKGFGEDYYSNALFVRKDILPAYR